MHRIPRHIILVAVGLLPLLVTASASANIVIDHTSIQLVPAYSQATMDAVAQSTFYFEHASVGSNIVDGLDRLHTSNPGLYQLTTSGVSSPPGTLLAGTVYEYARGNPDWTDKVADFASRINAGGIATTFALNKFCWIDENAAWTVYRDSMLTLEAAHTGTNFVYMTMPLNTGSGADNVLRNQFNTALRTWAATNNKTLFDIADIETYGATGQATTFTHDGTEYLRLSTDWASDEGHLNAAGQDRVALGFYALAAETAAIPEPSTYAIVLGLGTFAAVLWRRRGTSSPQSR